MQDTTAIFNLKMKEFKKKTYDELKEFGFDKKESDILWQKAMTRRSDEEDEYEFFEYCERLREHDSIFVASAVAARRFSSALRLSQRGTVTLEYYGEPDNEMLWLVEIERLVDHEVYIQKLEKGGAFWL